MRVGIGTRPCLRCRTSGCGPRPSRFTASRWTLNCGGGSYVPGFAVMKSLPDCMNAIFSAVEMLTFAHPRAMRSLNWAGGHPGAAVERHGDPRRRHDVGDALGIQGGRRRVRPVRVADRRGEHVDAGRGDEVDDGLERLDLLRLVARHLLGALEALDLALDCRAVAAGLGHDLDALARVLLDAQLRGVEQDGVPAGREARGDHRAVRAVVEVEGDRHADVRRHRRHIANITSTPVSSRCFTDVCTMSGARSSSAAASDGLHRQVVDDVDGRHAIALVERPPEDLLGRNDRHVTPP